MDLLQSQPTRNVNVDRLLLTIRCRSASNYGVKSFKVSATFRPKIYKWVESIAQQRQVSFSRQLEDIIEKQMDEDSIVTEQELKKLLEEVDGSVRD